MDNAALGIPKKETKTLLSKKKDLKQTPKQKQPITKQNVVHYFENTYRLRGDSPEEEIQIALIKAAKKMPLHQNLMEQALASPYALVQQTAKSP